MVLGKTILSARWKAELQYEWPHPEAILNTANISHILFNEVILVSEVVKLRE